jgi:hypothetical protein
MVQCAYEIKGVCNSLFFLKNVTENKSKIRVDKKSLKKTSFQPKNRHQNIQKLTNTGIFKG